MKDQVVLVNHQDRVIGVSDKIEAHLGEGKLHRAISVFLFNNQGELLIQQRSSEKIVGALLWANTCCGNVWPGETRKQCAIRRLKYELNINGVTLKKIARFEYHLRCNEKFSEWEIDDVFVGKYNGETNPNPKEVKNTRWLMPSEFMQEIRTQPELYAPWVQEIFKNSPIKKYFIN